MKIREVIVVGAGPYGLSTAAYLQQAGIEAYVVGKAMAYWKEHMPRGMFLRSGIEASSIAAPQKHLSLAAYQKATGRRVVEPIPIEDFIRYGLWFQERVAPNVDSRCVRNISHESGVFELTFEDGERMRARCAVLALGIGPFGYRPDVFAGVPGELAIHSSEVTEPTQFRGKRVAIIGKGQSALESAALLHESQANVQVLSRSSEIEYLGYPWRVKLFRTVTPGPLRRFSHTVFPPTDLGGFRTVRTIADPVKSGRQRPEVQEALARSVTRPIGAYWLRSRLEKVPIRTGVFVERADVIGEGVQLKLSDGSATWVDRVILGAGYRVDISRWRILDQSFSQRVERTTEGYPALTTGLETSVTGLYMMGVVAEKTLGPALRFVAGTWNAGPRATRAIVERERVHFNGQYESASRQFPT